MKRTRDALVLAAAGLLAAAGASAADKGERMQPPAEQRVAPSPQGQPQAQPAGEHYVVREGDTLAAIAEKKLGSEEKWRVIAHANSIDDPDALRVGQRLVIPERDDATGEDPTGREAEPGAGAAPDSQR